MNEPAAAEAAAKGFWAEARVRKGRTREAVRSCIFGDLFVVLLVGEKESCR